MPETDETFITDLINKLDCWFEKDSEFIPQRMSSDLYPYECMFSPIQINSVKIKNRIVLGPMGNVYMTEESGRPAQKMISFLTERAQGGVGLITTGLVPVGQGIDPGLIEPGGLSLFPRIDHHVLCIQVGALLLRICIVSERAFLFSSLQALDG